MAPRTATEHLLADLWMKVLQVDAIGIDDNFFELGGHSFMAVKLVHELQESAHVDLPLRRLFEQPTIRGLAAVVDGTGGDALEGSGPALDLVGDAQLDPSIRPSGVVDATASRQGRVLLTGATGFLGAFVLSELLDQTDAEVLCLVRAVDEAQAWQRIATQFDACGLDPGRLGSRVVPLPGDLGKPHLGLSPAAFAALALRLDAIYHVGALVNFAHPYSTLKAVNVLGTQEILRLAAEATTKPLHYVSTLGVLGTGATLDVEGRFAERDSPDRYDGVPVGYFESKWVAEKLVTAARDRGLPVAIFRPGIVAGDSRRGFSPATDLLARLLLSLVQMGSAPDLDFALDMAPVDFVARAIVHVSRQPSSGGQIFHLCGAAPTRFADLVAWIEASGHPLHRLPPAAWQEAFRSGSPEHALMPGLFDFTSLAGMLPTYGHGNTIAALATSAIRCPPIDATLVARYLQHLLQNVGPPVSP